jgi:hypothetical protein
LGEAVDIIPESATGGEISYSAKFGLGDLTPRPSPGRSLRLAGRGEPVVETVREKGRAREILEEDRQIATSMHLGGG